MTSRLPWMRENLSAELADAAHYTAINDPREAFDTLALVRSNLDWYEVEMIDNFRREHGHTWETLASTAGVSRQALRARYNRRTRRAYRHPA